MFDIGAITGKIVLDKSDWDESLSRCQRDITGMTAKMDKFTDSLRNSGRYLSSLGTRMIFLGSTLFAPFVLSIRTASQENYAFQNRLNSLGDSFKRIQAGLAMEMLPHLEKFTQLVGDLTKKFEDLNPALKMTITNFVVFSGLTLIVSGTLFKIVGSIMILGSGLTKLGTFLLKIIPLMAVFSTFRLMGLTTDVGVLAANVGILYPVLMTVGSAFAGWKLGEVIGKVTGLNEALSGEKGLFTKMFMWLDEKGLSEKWDNFWNVLRRKNVGVANVPTINLDKIVIKHQPTAIDTLIQKMGEFSDGFSRGLKNSIAELANFGKLGEEIAKRTATAMGTFFSDLFFNILSLQFKNIQETVANLGESILKMMSDILSRIVMYFAVISPLTVAFPALKPVFGLAEGTNYVPFTGIYKLHAGEEVKPSRYVDQEKKPIELTLYNLLTTDSVAAAMASREGQGVIVNVISADNARNGRTRRTIQGG